MKKYITPTITIIKIKNVDILTESIYVGGGSKGPSKSPFRSGNDDSDGYDY